MSEPVNNIVGLGEVLRLEEDELRMVLRRLDKISELQHSLGVEYERHLETIKKIKSELDDSRRSYASLVDALAEKHVKKSGKYNFRPELGGFTEQED